MQFEDTKEQHTLAELNGDPLALTALTALTTFFLGATTFLALTGAFLALAFVGLPTARVANCGAVKAVADANKRQNTVATFMVLLVVADQRAFCIDSGGMLGGLFLAGCAVVVVA